MALTLISIVFFALVALAIRSDVRAPDDSRQLARKYNAQRADLRRVLPSRIWRRP